MIRLRSALAILARFMLATFGAVSLYVIVQVFWSDQTLLWFALTLLFVPMAYQFVFNGIRSAVGFPVLLACRWRDYWIVNGGVYSVAVCRIAVAASVLLAFKHLPPDCAATCPTLAKEAYHPDGVLWYLGDQMLPPSFFGAMSWLAYVSVWALLAGFLTRIAAITCFASYSIIVALHYVSFSGWCHGHNANLLCLLILCFSRSGEALSLDSLWRRWTFKPISPSEIQGVGGHTWSVYLGQFTVAIMFFNACYHKLMQGEYSLRWALSDNLRNTFVLRYYFLEETPPKAVEFLLQHELLYKGAGILNLMCQGLPLLACFFVRRPLLRALFGACVVAEIIGLWQVMGLWNYHWLPLYAFFVDWDWLFGHLAAPMREGSLFSRLRLLIVSGLSPAPLAETHPANAKLSPRSVLASALITVFVSIWCSYSIYVAFFNTKPNPATFPFSSFGMYSEILAKKPHQQHQDFEMEFGRVQIECVGPIPPAAQAMVNRNYNHLIHADTLGAIKGDLMQVPNIIVQLVDGYDGTSLERVCFNVQAYPASPIPKINHKAMIARVDRLGEFTGVLMTPKLDVQQWYLEIQHEGLKNPRFRVFYLLNRKGPPIYLGGETRENRVDFNPKMRGHYSFFAYVQADNLDREELFSGRCLIQEMGE